MYKLPTQIDWQRRKLLANMALSFAVFGLPIFGRIAAAEGIVEAWRSVQFKKDGLRCAVLKAGGFAMSPATLFPQASEEALSKHGLNTETIPFDIHSLFVDTGKNKIVIDPGGTGDNSGRLLGELRKIDIDPESIDTVIISHAHCDHYQACTSEKGVVNFPNARYYLQKREWDYWASAENAEENHHKQFSNLLLPIKEQFELVDGETEIVPGVQALLTPGHSPGHMTVHMGKSIAYTGDAILQPAQVVHQAWCAEFNRWPAQVLSSRAKFIKRVALDKALVVGTHFPSPAAGFIVPGSSGFRWAASSPTII
ncbi:Glyoxylase, beta-lactamase superfamily II [Alteromonadaceae bacterium Bs31]|nr:Glyoxylase, beta-lactamase superfamily II [Alteromonadaceae bacterium Bs31]